MKHLRRALGLVVLVLAAVVLVQVGAAGPASAASQPCVVNSPWTSCWTNRLHANGNSHYIDYRFCSAPKWTADYLIKDTDNGTEIRRGHLNWGQCVSARIYGLYGYYAGWIFNTRAGANATLDNGLL
jgi:hypothetical protein